MQTGPFSLSRMCLLCGAPSRAPTTRRAWPQCWASWLKAPDTTGKSADTSKLRYSRCRRTQIDQRVTFSVQFFMAYNLKEGKFNEEWVDLSDRMFGKDWPGLPFQVLPPLKDVKMRPEVGTTLRNKLVRLMTHVDTGVKQCSAEFLFVLCKESGEWEMWVTADNIDGWVNSSTTGRAIFSPPEAALCLCSGKPVEVYWIWERSGTPGGSRSSGRRERRDSVLGGRGLRHGGVQICKTLVCNNSPPAPIPPAAHVRICFRARIEPQLSNLSQYQPHHRPRGGADAKPHGRNDGGAEGVRSWETCHDVRQAVQVSESSALPVSLVWKEQDQLTTTSINKSLNFFLEEFLWMNVLGNTPKSTNVELLKSCPLCTQLFGTVYLWFREQHIHVRTNPCHWMLIHCMGLISQVPNRPIFLTL